MKLAPPRTPWGCALALAFLTACAPSQSLVMVANDPATGVATAYATVFLDNVSRVVLSAPKGPGLVRATLWTDVTDEDCSEVLLTVDGHEIRPAIASAKVVQTPSGADQTVVFAVPPAVLRGLSERAADVSACGSKCMKLVMKKSLSSISATGTSGP